jgi:hypothetical protein
MPLASPSQTTGPIIFPGSIWSAPGVVLSVCIAFASCKKNPHLVAPAAQDVAKATSTPPATPVPEPVNLKAQVIVLCYHRFEDKPKDGLATKPVDFEAQMQALKNNGITVISMEDFLAWRRGEKGIPEKAAIISIDDGYLSGYNVAWPILKNSAIPLRCSFTRTT